MPLDAAHPPLRYPGRSASASASPEPEPFPRTWTRCSRCSWCCRASPRWTSGATPASRTWQRQGGTCGGAVGSEGREGSRHSEIQTRKRGGSTPAADNDDKDKDRDKDNDNDNDNDNDKDKDKDTDKDDVDDDDDDDDDDDVICPSTHLFYCFELDGVDLHVLD